MSPTEAREYVIGYSGTFSFLRDMRAAVLAGRGLSPGMVAAIARCAARDAARVPEADAVTEPGLYCQRLAPEEEPTVVRVARTRDGQRLYAQTLTRAGRRLTEADEVVRWEWQYAPGLVRQLRAGDRLTLDDAKAWGIRYGTCAVCGARLSDARSVADGIGPVCATRL